MWNDDEKKIDYTSDLRVNELVKYLSTRKEDQEQHRNTVMALVRKVAKLEDDNLTLRNRVEAGDYLFEEKRRQYGNPDQPQVIELPFNTSSVEIKLK